MAVKELRESSVYFIFIISFTKTNHLFNEKSVCPVASDLGVHCFCCSHFFGSSYKWVIFIPKLSINFVLVYNLSTYIINNSTTSVIFIVTFVSLCAHIQMMRPALCLQCLPPVEEDRSEDIDSHYENTPIQIY